MVTFGDVNLQEAGGIGGPYQAGAGGWPTVRYFNKATGYEGKPYAKKTSKAMCEELGDDQYMSAYIEEAGMTSKCVLQPQHENCSDKELDFMNKWKAKSNEEGHAQIERLRKLAETSMTDDLRKWLGQRLHVLVQLFHAAKAKEEL